ncbi:metal ABC transporter solute-binding protein, Zn/Mn family [Clostridium hydrogenum]|uniref:metal ABC transporter solute-binding protein, Zn/Mn family n=1 Tax=Clostridium hydrogenum TaxID=2855764 RepID=UPI001F1A0A1E|nr:zinc ABC transporter substrate-binding protein [Clostridium hydrogenum]
MKQSKLIKKHKYNKIGLLTVVALSFILSGCGTSNSSSVTGGKIIQAVGAENEYADVIKQIGGKYVSVIGIMSNPSADPHSYEANTKDSRAVSNADLIIENGLGYDDFMDKLEASSQNSNRKIINVAKTLGYGDNTKNPHLWYKPDTMTRVAETITKYFETKFPDKKSYFESNLTKFNASLKPFNNDIKQIQEQYAKAGVAVTEPVSDYMLEAADLDIKTPWAYQAAVMNGTDPSPQNVKIQEDIMKNKKVKVFIYNQQAIDDSTTALLKLAKSNNIPIVGVYETMPPNYSYQKWMQTEADSIIKALKYGVSREKI